MLAEPCPHAFVRLDTRPTSDASRRPSSPRGPRLHVRRRLERRDGPALPRRSTGRSSRTATSAGEPPTRPYPNLASTAVALPNEGAVLARAEMALRNETPIDDALAVALARSTSAWVRVYEDVRWNRRSCRSAEGTYRARANLRAALSNTETMLERWATAPETLAILDDARFPLRRLSSELCEGVADDARISAYLDDEFRWTDADIIVVAAPQVACQPMRTAPRRWIASRTAETDDRLEAPGHRFVVRSVHVETPACPIDSLAAESSSVVGSAVDDPEIDESDPRNWCGLARRLASELGADDFAIVANRMDRGWLAVADDRRLIARIRGRWHVVANSYGILY